VCVVSVAILMSQLAGCLVVDDGHRHRPYPPQGSGYRPAPYPPPVPPPDPYPPGGGYRPDWDESYSEKIVCASKDGRTQMCRTRFRIARVELDKQYSGSPCTWGRSWGTQDRAIWVTDGCRARFRAYPYRRR
jgi:hypothetical protein